MGILKDEHKAGDLIDGRYQLTQLIGRGGSGVVFRAMDLNLQSEIAVKIMSRECADDESVYRRFEREGRILRKLRHPNTVFFYDSGKTDLGLPYIVMEFVQGIQLKTLLERTPIITPERTVPILMQILSSLHEAHSLGFVHRDLKPSNIMLYSNLSLPGDFVKVLDFGVATLAEHHENETHSPDATRSIDVVGTPKYMAPEQFRSAPLTTLSDLYSTGCIAYEMLAGFMPFDGETFHMVIANHLFQKAPPFQAALDRYPVLTSTIFKLLEKEPENRIQSAQEVIDLLSHWNEPSIIGTLHTGPIAQPSPQTIPAALPPSTTAPATRSANSQHFSIKSDFFTPQRKQQAGLMLAYTLGAVLFAALTSVAFSIFAPSENNASRTQQDDVLLTSPTSVDDGSVIDETGYMDSQAAPYLLATERASVLADSSSNAVTTALAFALLPNAELSAMFPDLQAKSKNNDPEPSKVNNDNSNDESKPGTSAVAAKPKPQNNKAANLDFLKTPFELKVNYAPPYASVKFTNLTGSCQRGVCKLKTQNATGYPTISVVFSGYQSQKITVKKKTATLTISLKRKTM